ncbi:MAG: SDR family oxidoreductase [Burkholderiaceae bacterium]|nr:SDR family oxidoreductase [Burkholderiaceae bacterium]
MEYFVTGATGFIGRRLVRRLLARRGAIVHFLVRDASPERLDALYAFWGVDRTRAVPVEGDLTRDGLGIDEPTRAALQGRIRHLFHLAAIYDLTADAQRQIEVNVEGTRRVVAFAAAIGAGCLHHVSSIAAAGLYEGVFREDMFDEAQGLEHPYFATKHESEGIVRRESRVPFRIYRPGMVVGDSRTGEIDKVDGPMYFFKPLQRLRRLLPQWMPMVGIEGGRINIVPVDYVVAAMDHIAHARGLDGKCFHLVDPHPLRVGDVLNVFAKAAHAPQMSIRINAALIGLIPRHIRRAALALAPVRRIRDALMHDLGLPPDILQFVNYPTRFDSRQAIAALEGTGIACPRLDDYAWVLWDYWERHLDPELAIDRTLRGQVAGKVVLITGGSSGIGLAAARRVAAAGATTIICGRDPAKLEAARVAVQGDGRELVTFACDLSDADDCDRFVRWLHDTYGHVDVLVNNAGRSIRRGIESTFGRFHDLERLMQLNYFGAVRLTMGMLPAMIERRSGHVVNISSIGVLTNAPRFSGYVASKAALDAWTRCAASEFADVGITFTSVAMPLVRTPMIAPTGLYRNAPTLTPEEAADLVTQAIVYKPVRIATRLGVAGEVLHALMPRVAQIVMNTSFRMFPESSAAAGGAPAKITPDQEALQQMMRGIHF